MGNDRDNRGQYQKQHTDSDVLAAVREHEPAATSEVAAELGIARQSADYRLRNLREEERVESKKIGASLVWFAPAESVDK
ncbi:helix-turn-helix domain-containing protein [Halalkalicoccus salilacus]|uniref:helix-turn-helix domain-containing protein n=1 Tax=Halalkalicoccus salilacus TaxID=3117459 RepID=UPI00300E6EC4